MPNEERSLGELIGDITSNFGTLVREEIALAKAELKETVSTATTDVVLVALGAIIAYTGLLALIAAAILGLAWVVDPWLSALIVGGVIAVIGLLMLFRGLSKLRALSVPPERSAESLKKDAELVKEKLP